MPSNANLDLCTSDVVTEEPQTRRRTFLAGSAAAVLASGGEGNAQQAQDATGELNVVVTRRVQAGKEEEVGRCHTNLDRRGAGFGRPAELEAAVAARHVRNASSRRTRSVRRDVR